MLKNTIFSAIIIGSLSTSGWASDTNIDKKIAAVVVIDQKHGLPYKQITNFLWDNIRRCRFNLINNKSIFCCDSAYDNVYIITGEQARNNKYMREIWWRAQNYNDIIDYFSFVHENQQKIKEAWNVKKHSGKLRYAHSEACHGGHNGEHFIKEYGFILSSGHSGHSASPYFTYGIIKNWIDGQNLTDTMQNTWNSTVVALTSNDYSLEGLLACCVYQPVVKMLGDYKSMKEVLEQSQLNYAWRKDLDISNFDFLSKMPDIIKNSYYKTGFIIKNRKQD